MAALLCLCAWPSVAAQAPTEQALQKLADEGRWQEIVRQLQDVHPRTAAMDFDYGMALARLQRWDEARHALEAGQQLAPADPRFPTELAGIAFTQKNNPRAVYWLRKAVRLRPGDAYGNNFLGAVYDLDGNLPAALKYWNRVGKPQIAHVRDDPTPGVSPALLDHAFTFSATSVLTQRQLLDTQERVRGLGIFPQYQLDLQARSDGSFDVLFRSQERDGWGDSKGEALLRLLRGLPFQQVDPEVYDLHREAINFVSFLRWDAQKRRVFATLSGPFEQRATVRWELMADLRDENWDVRRSFAGPAPTLASFHLRSAVAAFDLASYARERWQWKAGASLSHRDFRNVAAGAVLTSQMLAAGYELKQTAQLSGTLWRLPERRFAVRGQAGEETARLWAHRAETFEKLTGTVGWQWFPQAVGDDYEMQEKLCAGRIFGQAPWDELYILGLERDNDLPMRAHIGTRDGRKGSAPLGSRYLLHSWEIDKNVYGNGLMRVQLGPFLDTGAIADPGTALGSQKWLWDTGVEAKLHVLGSGIAFSYGKDLRSGNNAFYVRLIR